MEKVLYALCRGGEDIGTFASRLVGPVAAALLEPASEDGLVTWNFFDRNLRRGQPAPVLRMRAVPAFPSENLP